jgi:hypothetical protein
MWEKPTTYAVKKIGGVRAKRVFSIKAEAQDLVATLKDHEIEVREGSRTRCTGFCQVSQFCPQYQQYVDERSTTLES